MGPPTEGRPSADGRGVGVGVTGPAPREERQRRQHQNSPSFDANTQSTSPRPGNARAFDGRDGSGQQSNGAPYSPTQSRELPMTLTHNFKSERSRDDLSRNRERERTRTNGAGGKSTSSSAKTCIKCEEPMVGQFVRALGGTFHIECFKCRDCDQIVASKFFPVDQEDGTGQYPLCETDYFRRLDLLCYECGGALRGSYITAIERKYHIEHFTCSVCPTVFGAQDSYYEHDDKVYCHYHYSTQFAQKCNGCQTAILKQFVEIFRNGETQFWHPECYMIHKFWNVRLAPSGQSPDNRRLSRSSQERDLVRQDEEKMEEKVYRIWSVLSTFEESSAACISDMLLHVSNGAYMDGVLVAKKFIFHVDMLFNSLDRLDQLMAAEGISNLSYGREAKLLCKKIVAFFQLLSKTQESGVRKLGVTQELLSLVTGLAHYLKLLIRISLQGTLRLERERHNIDGLHHFLDDLGDLEPMKEAERSADLVTGVAPLAEQGSDLCTTCKGRLEEQCIKKGLRSWHLACLSCSNCVRDLGKSPQDARWIEAEQRVLCSACARGRQDAQSDFEHVTKLQQYVFLLHVALARLLSMLRAGGTLPHTSGKDLSLQHYSARLTFLDDPNLATYDSKEGHRVSPSGQTSPPLLRSNTRSKSYGATSDGQPESSYEQTLGDIRRLRSTRMDKHLSNTIRKARTSRIIDGPEGRSIRPGSAGADGSDVRTREFQIVEERDVNGDPLPDLTFGDQNALTLDDIPRIVAAEQAKDQRPNAYKHARNQLLGSGGGQPKLLNGHVRNVSGGQELDRMAADEQSPQREKKYFSELTALEYFIVRHVAVLSMEPLVQGHMNLEELLELIENRKPTFWNKFGKAFKNDGRKGGKKKGVFGVGLDALIERDGVESSYGNGPGVLRIPAIVDDAVSAMRSMDMSVEGVFRKNGNIRRLKDIAENIDTKGSAAVDLSKENPVQVAALLKKFLRELPDPLLTSKLHRLFITSSRIPDDEKRRRILHLTCCLLPKSHRDAMEVLFAFLNWTSSFSQVDEESGSKMDIHNLATVVTPNILYLNNKSSGMDDSFLAIEAVNSLIECHQAMSVVPEDLQSILDDNSLFNGSADLTTKEILKRYGDIGKTPTPQQTPQEYADSPPPRSKEGRHAPAITRVGTDPYQANAWQMESSVRHVQGSQSAPTGGPNRDPDNQSPLPRPQFKFSDSDSPYRSRAGSGASQSSHGTPNRNSQDRGSGWGKSPGAVGVTGA
ncbi:MAG: hypothetical protein M4579_005964 [Chaenotheca gracillima]|nr:MAG: hypothetical protein M4579_005964 [Chaenotheca gracillima]